VSPRLRRRLALGAAVAVAAVAAPVAAVAIPPAGPAENPGDPPATVTILTPSVRAPDGKVSFRGAGFLNAKGQPQKVYVKLDDHGDDGIGPYVAAADGTLKGSVALSDPEAPADVADASEDHWLRFLAGPSGKDPDNGPARSLKASFKVVAPPVRATGTALRARSGRVALALVAGAASGVEGTATVRRAGVTLARGSFALPDAEAHTVRIALTAAGRRALKAGRTLAARLVLAPSSGVALTTAVTVRG
jgi:hypothetical protein